MRQDLPQQYGVTLTDCGDLSRFSMSSSRRSRNALSHPQANHQQDMQQYQDTSSEQSAYTSGVPWSLPPPSPCVPEVLRVVGQEEQLCTPPSSTQVNTPARPKVMGTAASEQPTCGDVDACHDGSVLVPHQVHGVLPCTTWTRRESEQGGLR